MQKYLEGIDRPIDLQKDVVDKMKQVA